MAVEIFSSSSTTRRDGLRSLAADAAFSSLFPDLLLSVAVPIISDFRQRVAIRGVGTEGAGGVARLRRKEYNRKSRVNSSNKLAVGSGQLAARTVFHLHCQLPTAYCQLIIVHFL